MTQTAKTQTPELRLGKAQDAEAIARLTIAAGDGLNEYLLHDIMPGNDPADLLTMAIMDPNTVLFYENTIIADIDGQVAGIASCYGSDQYGMPEDLLALIPDDRLAALSEFLERRIDDSLYLHALAVDPDFRRQGLAGALIAAVGTLADDLGFEKVSLHVWADNEAALNLYRKSGFEISCEIPMPSDERQRHSGGMCLMVADVS